MAELILTNATVFTGTEVLPDTTVRVSEGRIESVEPTDRNGSGDAAHTIYDLRGRWLVPGLVDLQLYGGSEQFLNGHPTAGTVRHILDTHRRNGTTTVLPTLYSTSYDVIDKAIRAVREVRAEHPLGVPGLHVEGPYVNPEKRGAHSLSYVRPPDARELNDLLTAGRDVIKILTIAPEVFTPEQLQWLQRTPFILSAGHTNATYRQATEAFDNGIPLATHLYNAMRGFESREPGTAGAILDHPTVRASIVVDGFHCDFAAVRLAHRLLGDRLFLISDAIFANPPRPALDFEDFVIRYHEGRYTNQEGKLAGSSITLLDAVRNGIRHVGLKPEEALRMASTVPAEIIGLGDQLGKIAPGYVANLVVLDEEWRCREVFAT
ncbi:N-acetylglucosamine-6-phosphate deacetylase [Tellurirhabdus rosea]|uniref:N-acetylglucosamine-6-phosphate deacetylase n=1 Tax=Tellurirhabdus rosea TaxID=2674997 RepID=UPI0022526EC9|nr:N-acetylglucosamine-6-phosphate deacetylase [Tellurirhabdus rosea]